MVTANDWVEETRAHLFSGQEAEANRLDGAITNSATQITFKYDLGSITRGAVIAIDLEDIRIWETSGKVATVVERAVNGTAAASHSDLAYVEVRPKFSKFRILRALNEELQDLSAPYNGLFKVTSLNLTYVASKQAYDLTGATNVIDILELRFEQPGPSLHWPLITKYDVFRSMDTADFASGFAVTVYEGGHPGLPIRARYSTTFTSLSALATDVSTSGLPTTAYDIPPLGAAIRLVAPREIPRNFMEAQQEPRRAEEVPPGAVMQSTRELQRLRMQRIAAEAARLANDWGIR